MDPSSAQNGRRSQALFLLPPPLPPPLTSFTQPLALGNEPQRQLVRGLGCRPQIDSTFATWREVSPFWSSLAPSSNFCNRSCFQAVAFTGAEAPSHASWHPTHPRVSVGRRGPHSGTSSSAQATRACSRKTPARPSQGRRACGTHSKPCPHSVPSSGALHRPDVPKC